jgi:MoaA/NifB/PqqE/SkfB family radical SAM enzyme
MRILCLGNNTEDTDQRATAIASNVGLSNYGLISDLDSIVNLNNLNLQEGVYHTSVYDMVPGRIITLAKQFQRVLVLDQPKEEWSHPDSYLNTIDLAKGIPHIEFESSLDFDLSYWEDLVNNNKSICIFPFIELLVQNGNTTVCCRSREKVTTLKELGDFNNNKEYNKIRNNMLADNPVSNCEYCYRVEKSGLRSARQQETIEWANRLNLRSVDDLKTVNGPAYYEVRPSNNCNLQCRICSPHFSKLIEDEYNQLGLHDPQISYQYSDFDFVNISKIKKLYVAGGEPTAMPEFYKFLRDCISNNTVDFEFVVNTNAHKVSSTLLKLGAEFDNLQFIVSVDGFEKANEYSRWLSNWNKQVENVHRLINNGHKVTFNVSVSIYTIFSFAQLIKFLESEFPKSLIHAQYVYGDRHPFIIEYSADTIEQLKTLTNTDTYKGDNLFRSFVDTIVSDASNSRFNKTKLKKFFEFNDLLDESRSVKLADYIPELEAYRNEC